MIYKSNKPYPILKVERRNTYFAKLLLEDYAGKVSEESAIHLYLYQSLITDNNLKEYKEIMKKIAEVEMHHLFLLGEIIKLLGLKPIFGSFDCNNFRNWNSSYVNYSTNLKEMIIEDIKSEKEAIMSYQKHFLIIKDKYVREMIKRIIEDEEIHLNIFYSLYSKFFSVI